MSANVVHHKALDPVATTGVLSRCVIHDAPNSERETSKLGDQHANALGRTSHSSFVGAFLAAHFVDSLSRSVLSALPPPLPSPPRSFPPPAAWSTRSRLSRAATADVHDLHPPTLLPSQRTLPEPSEMNRS